MAKGTTIGFLNFGIDGDNKELLKKLEQAKKEAVSIEQIFKNIKLNTGGNSISTDVQKAQVAADKLAISQNKVTQSAMNAAKAEKQVEIAIVNENNARAKGLIFENQRQSALQKSLLYAKQGEAVSAESARKEVLAKQKLLIEEERLNGLRKRNSLIGVQGQKDLAAAYGLTNKTMFSQKNLLQQLSSAAGIYFSVYQVAGFVKELATISGEFEKQRVSLAAIIGDADAANKIFNQLKDLAVISPFNFKELTDYAKQLSAFSIPTNEIYDTTKRLADLSAGLGVDMSRIILAYGQVRSAAVLRGQELRQFTEAGIPLVDELAKKFGELEGRVVSAGEVFDKISNREASFGMVKEIINDLTSEGGKFFEMQELQSATLAGKISNLRDNYDMMLDSLGRANSGLLHGAMDGIVEVMDNWEKYWNILKGIIVTYGTYRTAIFLIAQGTTLAANAQKLYNTYLLMSSVSGAKFGSVIDMMSVKFRSLDAVTKTTLVGGVIAAIVGIGYAIKTAYDESNKLEKSLSENFGKLKGSADASVLSLDNMLIRLKNATAYSTEWNDIIKQINKSYGEYLPSLLKESDSYTDIETKIKGVTAAIYEKAKAQSYASSINIIEDELSNDLSKAYDSALKSLTDKPLLGFDQVILSKKEADEVIKQAFAAIKESPELYREKYEVQKLVSGILSEAFKGRNVDTSVSGLLNYTQLDGLFEGVNQYAQSWNTAAEAMNNAKEKNDIIYNQNDSYAKQIDLISQKYNTLAKEIDKTPISNGFNVDKAKADNTIKMLGEMLEVYKQFGQFDLARGVENQIESIRNAGNEWRKILSESLSGVITIQDDNTITDVISNMQKVYKEGKAVIENQDPILLKWGLNYTTGDYPIRMDMPSVIKAQLDAVSSQIKAYNKVTSTAKDNGITLLGDKKTSTSSKDSVAEKLKKRIDLLKDIRSEYDKLVKSGKSSEDAANYLMGLDSFKGIDARNYDQDVQKIIDDLKNKGKLSEQQRSLLESLILGQNKDKITKEVDRITKESKAAIEKIEKELSQYKDQYSLYEYIFGKTGDKGQAMKIAFGDIEGQVKTYRDALVSVIEKTTDSDQKKKLQEQLIDFDFTQKSDFSKRMTDLVLEFQSVDEQITTIKAKGEATRIEIEKNADNASRTIVEQRMKANQDLVNKQIADLTSGVLQSTEAYQRLFGDIADISQKELQYLIDKWKNALSEATKNADGSMTVSIDGSKIPTTEKEIASLTKRVLKSESELRSRNPFKALKDSLNELNSNKSKISDIKSQIENLEKIRNAALSDQENGNGDESTNHIIGSTTSRIKTLTSELENMQAKGATSVQKVGTAFAAIGSEISAISQSLSGMFDSLGNEDLADTIGLVGELASAASDIGQGLASKNPVQVIQGIAKGISSIANFHDKKLDKAIKKSQLEVKRLQNAYASLERFISRQLGATSEKQANDLINNQKKQIDEINKQISSEKKKKKTDWSAVSDMEAQLDEAKDKLKYFYEDLADEQYGINLKDWASQLSDALVNAFSSGEDAAKAFDNTVADIMKNVIKNMIQLSVIEPAMENLRNKLFGEGGLLANGTTDLSKSDGAEIIKELISFKDKVGEAQGIWDYLNEAAKEAGISLENQADKDTLSKGIQALTEDTGSLLASYLNAMRAEQARQGVLISNIIAIAQTHTDQFANMYAELLRIQVNTLATANNTAVIAETTTATYNLLRQATIPSSGTAINLA
ncbi:MAG: tape measure protein [Dysgonomonas sp.]